MADGRRRRQASASRIKDRITEESNTQEERNTGGEGGEKDARRLATGAGI